MSEKKTTVSPLEEHLGLWMRRVSNHVSQRFADGLAAREIAVAEWVLLRELFNAAAEPSALAERIGMTRGAITKIVDKLVAKGFAQRVSREDDRRFQRVELTAAGKKIVPILAEIADANDAACFAGLHKSERTQLIALLKKLADTMELRYIPTE
ncbi:MAG: MarR family transcriptional regulator [Acidobacteria bacterium]|nr:MarR family transcriptional regulator [Acidobacteriota bacterium]